MVQTIEFLLLTAFLGGVTWLICTGLDRDDSEAWLSRRPLWLEMTLRAIGCLLFVGSAVSTITSFLIAVHLVPAAFASFWCMGVVLGILCLVFLFFCGGMVA